MVQTLRELIELDNFDKASLKEAFSLFKCAHQGQEAQDIEKFLVNEALPKEENKEARTYLFIDDTEWNNGKIKIDGYFTICLKNIYFNNIDKDILYEIFNNKDTKNIPAFLIGQFGRALHTKAGVGVEYLNYALSIIATASNIVGGKFIYLDCSPERQKYYEENGFTFLREKPKSNLIQMFTIL